MHKFHEVAFADFTWNPFKKIGAEWMLIAAEKEGRVNAMTASWGGVGVIWGKNAAYIFVRDSRFTKEFIDAADTFSLTFFDRPEHSEMLAYMGKVSGRDEDKIEKTGLSILHEGETPYFGQASMVMVCRKMCRQPIEPGNFLDGDIIPRYYSTPDFHDMYIGEITKILVRD